VYLETLGRELVIVALLVAVAGIVRFEWFCLSDIRHAPYVRVLSRQGWIVLCLVTIPLGGLMYLLYGRPR
jgi:hypothetical protein